ncbi:MFS transporter [Bacillus sp. FJAT-42376]|uniref:MDR family MFS transporter n=1 Tax=Bacillus sp. FJAT-42376 TaxID=2014076 RepID=UPI000F509DD3|nr:MFS transporter [Bacillus sp. FJAT-42376]AZB44039.1 MFS transporter [Bacillus sp. FJAT-42376]
MPRSLWLLVIGMIINVTGASFLWPLNTIYIHEELGKSLTVAGLVLMLNSGASVVGNLAGGVLFDKMGGFRSILLGIVITLSALIVMIFFHSWPYYVILLAVIGFGSGIVFPAMYAMAGSVWPEGGRKSFNAIYVAQNAGVAIGSALGGLVASISFQWIFTANGLLYVLFFLVAFFGYRNIQGETIHASTVVTKKPAVKDRTKFTALATLSVAYLLCWVAYVQWQSTIAAHTQTLNIDLKQYSFLWTINGLLIVLGQPLLAAFVKRFARTLKSQMLIGMGIFMVSFVIAASVQEFTGFLAAMIILTIGEMLVWPAVPTIANDLAPKGREGFYQGFVNSTATAGRMVGPLLGGILVDVFNMPVMFAVLIGLLVISFFITIVYDRHIKYLTNEDFSADSAKG